MFVIASPTLFTVVPPTEYVGFVIAPVVVLYVEPPPSAAAVAAPSLFTFASSDCNWLTFTASVPLRPAATFVMRRSLPAAPTDTSPPAAVAADSALPPGLKPAVASVVEFATEFEPSATEFAVVALALPPMATASVPVADESASVEFVWKYLMPAPLLMLLRLLPNFPSAVSTVLNALPTLVAAPDVPSIEFAFASA
nr:hypothetical protein [Paraburkholderia phenoliruptrix]